VGKRIIEDPPTGSRWCSSRWTTRISIRAGMRSPVANVDEMLARAGGSVRSAQWLHPRRAAVTAIVRRAVAQGEIRDGTDVDVIVDALP
jgi:hypothetical protein